MSEEKFLTPEEAAERFNVAPKTIRAWLREGTLKGTKMGRLWRISEKDLLERYFKHHVDQSFIKGKEPEEKQEHHQPTISDVTRYELIGRIMGLNGYEVNYFSEMINLYLKMKEKNKEEIQV